MRSTYSLKTLLSYKYQKQNKSLILYQEVTTPSIGWSALLLTIIDLTFLSANNFVWLVLRLWTSVWECLRNILHNLSWRTTQLCYSSFHADQYFKSIIIHYHLDVNKYGSRHEEKKFEPYIIYKLNQMKLLNALVVTIVVGYRSIWQAWPRTCTFHLEVVFSTTGL